MTLIELAQKLRPLIEQAVASLDDKSASEGVELFPRMKYDRALVKSGTRINWKGSIKRARVDLWALEINDPDNAPTLWEDISYRSGIRIAPDLFTSTNAASKGELMWFGDEVYKSLKDGNVHTPEQAPAVWELVKG